jgi:hypothetical protein
MRSRLPSDITIAEKDYLTFVRFAVGTIISPIGVHLASALIIPVSAAAAAAKLQLKVGCGFEILEDSFRGSEMVGEKAGTV